MMTKTVAPPTTITLAAPTEKGERQTGPYRIRKPLAVVQFDLAAKGRIVFLPEGAELSVVGPSCMRACFEVMCENQVYNIFKTDLLGFWSAPGRVKPAQAMAALGACA
jgi:hypothetical protein